LTKKERFMRNRLATPAVCGLALVMAACGSNRQGAPATAAPPVAEQEVYPEEPGMAPEEVPLLAEPCPMDIEGTTVEVEETVEGMALVFETREGDVNELRQEVEAMAQMHERHHEDLRERGVSPDPTMMPEARMMTQPVEDGMRVELIAEDPAEIEELREHVHAMAEELRMGRCPGMTDEVPASAD
jgi:hypothetical protein